MSFRCSGCHAAQRNTPPWMRLSDRYKVNTPHSRVVETRPKTYFEFIRDSRGKVVINPKTGEEMTRVIGHGTEIVKESNFCAKCVMSHDAHIQALAEGEFVERRVIR